MQGPSRGRKSCSNAPARNRKGQALGGALSPGPREPPGGGPGCVPPTWPDVHSEGSRVRRPSASCSCGFPARASGLWQTPTRRVSQEAGRAQRRRAQGSRGAPTLQSAAAPAAGTALRHRSDLLVDSLFDRQATRQLSYRRNAGRHQGHLRPRRPLPGPVPGPASLSPPATSGAEM